MSDELKIYIATDSPQEVLTLLNSSKFSDFISRNRDSKGRYFFRIRDGQKTIGRSKTFSTSEERDVVFSQFIDWIEVKLHQNHQRSFEFK